jgi:hypothetical protein
MNNPPDLSRTFGYIRGELAASACALVLMAMPVQAVDVGALGGQGGGEFRTACRPGDALVGIDALEKNGVITRVAPICGDRRVSSTDTYGSPWAGTDDGARHQVACPPDAVLTILHVFADTTPLVSRIGFTCWNMKTNEMTNRLPDFGGVDTGNQRFFCPDGHIGSGIYGRAGTAIDQLGLSCEPIPVAVTAPPPEEVAPDPQPQPAQVLVRATMDTDIYDAPQGNYVRMFAVTDPPIELVGCRDDRWCQLVEGWVWGEHIEQVGQ